MLNILVNLIIKMIDKVDIEDLKIFGEKNDDNISFGEKKDNNVINIENSKQKKFMIKKNCPKKENKIIIV